jgi:hypothetical protein
MKEKDTITIYWTSPNFSLVNQSWTMLYSEPQSLASLLREQKTDSDLFGCPAHNDFTFNKFVFKVNIADKHTLPIEYLSSNDFLDNKTKELVSIKNTGGLVDLYRVRPNSFKDYTNLVYNLSWIFFADEPVLAKFVSPYCFPKPPAPGVFLTPGQYDIGKWYRQFNLDYHIPLNTKTLIFEENNPLFYIEFDSIKKIEFKEYNYSSELKSLAEETSAAPFRYGSRKSLKERYRLANNGSYRNKILTEIKKNLIEE